MPFTDIFQAFSRRTPSPVPDKRLTQSFRNRVLMRCRDVFGASAQFEEFWSQIHSKLTYLHGAPGLSPAGQMGRASAVQDSLTFLTSCSDEHFLDFLEFVFRVNASFHIPERDTLVDDFNEFLNVDSLPYSVTPFVWTKGVVTQYGREYESTTLTGYPQVIRKDSELVYATAIAPALALLAESRFAAANAEFLAALKDYRHGDFGDCLTKSGSALESVMKVVCQAKGWPSQPTDTASTLLKTIVSNTSLEPFFEQPIILVATLRNRLSTAHGAGAVPRAVSRGKAEYALNATAAAVLLIVRETA